MYGSLRFNLVVMPPEWLNIFQGFQEEQADMAYPSAVQPQRYIAVSSWVHHESYDTGLLDENHHKLLSISNCILLQDAHSP